MAPSPRASLPVLPVKLVRDLDLLADDLRGAAVAIGNFDGVHLGHARIVARLMETARGLGGAAVVFTFDPHPATLLRPERAPPPLTTTFGKAELLAELGVDAVIAFPTDMALLRLSPAEFFDRIVRNRLAARALVEGPNFRFGRDRAGTIDVLEGLARGAGLGLTVVEPVLVDGEPVSSSRVRRLISAGEVDAAGRLLTRPYRIRGVVARGAGRGAGIGFPTANLEQIETLLPREGVYAGRGSVGGETSAVSDPQRAVSGQPRRWPAAINIGPSPTFGEQVGKVEVHLVGFGGGFGGQLYGATVEVDFRSRLRDIQPFNSVDALREQLARDVAAAKRYAE